MGLANFPTVARLSVPGGYLLPDLSLSAYETTLTAAIAHTLASSTAQVAHLNRELRKLYLMRFADWAANVDAGRIPNTGWPLPPMRYELFEDSLGFSWPAEGESEPVSEVPPIPADRTKPQVPEIVEGNEVGSVRNVSKGDTLPAGAMVTAPDGGVWQKMASPTPFGVAYYWQRVR